MTTLSSPPSTWKKYLRFIMSCLGAGILALQLYFLLSIVMLRWFDPSSTAFMHNERWRLCGVNFWSCSIQHQWVPYNGISGKLKYAVIASEDSGFVYHDGFEFDAIKKAWKKNTRRGKVVSGGSTISQQLAKNLFLTGEKNYLRKLQEFLITAMLEAFLSKERILEVYLNSVEWGEGIFGAEAAAKHYFGTSAKTLNTQQAARLASALPAPKCFDKRKYCAKVRINFNSRAQLISARMSAVDLPD